MFSEISTTELSPAALEARRDALGLTATVAVDAELLQSLVIGPRCETIVSAFYHRLFEFAEARAFLRDPEVLDRLRLSQSRYLRTLGIGVDTNEYADERLRIGRVHARVGLAPWLYLTAFGILTDLLLDEIAAATEGNVELERRLVRFVQAITSYDKALAIETYHVTEVKALERSLDELRDEGAVLRRKASTDSLTGLSNRAAVQDYLHMSLDRLEIGSGPVTVAMIDIDHFKRINDRYGHIVGDAALVEVSRRILAATRSRDVVGRFGGEEFLVVFRDARLHEAREVAERIRVRVGRSRLSLGAIHIPITVSIGLAEARPGEEAAMLVARSDVAMYAAKAAGRNNTQLSEEVGS